MLWTQSMCFFRWGSWAKDFWQSLQVCGFSPVCILKWSLRAVEWEKDLDPKQVWSIQRYQTVEFSYKGQGYWMKRISPFFTFHEKLMINSWSTWSCGERCVSMICGSFISDFHGPLGSHIQTFEPHLGSMGLDPRDLNWEPWMNTHIETLGPQIETTLPRNP